MATACALVGSTRRSRRDRPLWAVVDASQVGNDGIDVEVQRDLIPVRVGQDLRWHRRTSSRFELNGQQLSDDGTLCLQVAFPKRDGGITTVEDARQWRRDGRRGHDVLRVLDRGPECGRSVLELGYVDTPCSEGLRRLLEPYAQRRGFDS